MIDLIFYLKMISNKSQSFDNIKYKINFINNSDNKIYKIYLNKFKNFWNNKQFFEIEKLKFNIKNNSFLNQKQINEIIELFYINLKLLNIVRKIEIKFFKNKNIKFKPLNNDTLYLEEIFLVKDKEIIDIPTTNNNFYRFQKNELIDIFNSAIFNRYKEWPMPKSPQNPYTNIVFSLKDFYIIYNQIKKKFNKIPLVFEILKTCYYDINILKKKYKNALLNKALINYIQELPDERFYNKITYMFNYFYINTCTQCLKNIPNVKNYLENFLKEFIKINNSLCVSDENILKFNIENFLKSYNILNIDLIKHRKIHRHIFVSKKSLRLPNQYKFIIKSSPGEIFIFQSKSNKDAIIKRNRYKFLKKRRHVNYLKRNKTLD